MPNSNPGPDLNLIIIKNNNDKSKTKFCNPKYLVPNFKLLLSLIEKIGGEIFD